MENDRTLEKMKRYFEKVLTALRGMFSRKILRKLSTDVLPKLRTKRVITALLLIVALAILLGGSWVLYHWHPADLNGWRNLTLIIAGILGGFVGLPLAVWRSVLAHKQTNTAILGQNADRFQKGAAMLGDGEETVRQAGIFFLRELVGRDTKTYYTTVLDLLCAFVRNKGVAALASETEEPAPKFTADCQSVMEAISFLRKNSDAQKRLEKNWRLDLSGANLREAKLSEANLSEANLRKADLSGAKLSEAKLSEANLRKADLREANLSEANLFRANLRKADLRKADLSGADLREAKLSEADLSGADLREADLREANLFRADLSGAKLRKADLREAKLREANLGGANLRKADLSKADLREADLSKANLRKADLRVANLTFLVGANDSNQESVCRLAVSLCQAKSLEKVKLSEGWSLEGDGSKEQPYRIKVEGVYADEFIAGLEQKK